MRPALRALDVLPEPMPAKHVPGPVEIYAPAPMPARPWATEIPDDEVAVTRSEPALSPKAAAKLHAFDAAPPSTPAPVPFDEAPEAVVVVTRKLRPAAQETPMPSTTSRCPCGAPSAPTADRGGRPSTPEFRDLCETHRHRALRRRSRTGEGPVSARAWALGETISDTAPVVKTSKAPASKPRPSKPAASKPTAEAPVSDLLALVRRQRAVVDALGGIDQAEAIARAAARVGGPEALVQLVDELVGAVA